jgi:hypothetical protein
MPFIPNGERLAIAEKAERAKVARESIPDKSIAVPK